MRSGLVTGNQVMAHSNELFLIFGVLLDFLIWELELPFGCDKSWIGLKSYQ